MKHVGLCIVRLAAILGTGRTASASPVTIDALEAGPLLTNTIPDVDLDSITLIYGYTQNEELSMSGTINTTGFTESLTGTYQGNLLNISYTGDLTAYRNTVTWTTTGS